MGRFALQLAVLVILALLSLGNCAGGQEYPIATCRE